MTAAEDQSKPAMQPPTQTQLIESAREHARSKGITVDRYKVLSVRARGTTTEVTFHNENGPPGDHLTVTVDTATGKATGLLPGM